MVAVILFCVSFGSTLSSRVVDENSLNSWGYQTQINIEYPYSYCDVDGPKPIAYFIQSIRQEKSGGNQYTLIKEAFESCLEAQARLQCINTPNENIKYSKVCGLRKAFVDSKFVYILHTKSFGWFDKEFDRVFSCLKNFVATPQNSDKGEK